MGEGTAISATEDRLREVLDGEKYECVLGDWDEWTKKPLGGYNALTVTARSTLAHLHGLHDDTTDPYAHCVLCMTFRVPAPHGSRREGEGCDNCLGIDPESCMFRGSHTDS